jgi:hypothetical protein
MSFRDSFTQSRYDDAPHLSDQLLLPNMAKGHDVHLFSAFAPSYLFRLLNDLAESPEVEPGFLSITFFVPGDLTLKSSGIARFRNYLLKYATNEQDVALFVNHVLQIAEEGAENEAGGIRVSILHTSQKRALTKGCIGVVSSSETPDEYVAFADERGGDYNSPVKPLKSWEDSDYFAAEDVLRKVIEASTGRHPRGTLVSEQETLDWFTYLSNWYVENPPAQPETIESEADTEVAEDKDEEEEQEEQEDEFLGYLRDLADFEDEENFGWFGIEDEIEELFVQGNFGVVVSSEDMEFGHIPPLPSSIADLVGPAQARCPCGQLIVRAYGCDQVSWV